MGVSEDLKLYLLPFLIPLALVGLITVSSRHVARLFNAISAGQRLEFPPLSKSVSASSFEAAWPITPEMCDTTGRLYGGELLKLVDVMAGVASRKHCDCKTVTISVDRVIFLSEMRCGDICHLSVSVNRAWTTSLETGVRCMREDGQTGKKTYACHAYLTFVAHRPIVTSGWSNFMRATVPRYRVPAVEPETMLERKRYLLAGRRRGHRIQRQPIRSALLAAFRKFVFKIPLAKRSRHDEAAQEAQILKLQRELIVEAYLCRSDDVHVSKDGTKIIAELEGFMERIEIPMDEVNKAAKATGRGAFRRLDPVAMKHDLPSPRAEMMDGHSEQIHITDTLAVSMWIVRPQHTNSNNHLFGGQLLLWLEQVSFMAARKVAAHKWSTATIDGMTFKESIQMGETVFIRALALHAWESSIEIYAVVTAESVASPARFVADAFLTLIAIDPTTGRPQRGRLRHLTVPEGPAQDLARGAAKRRDERLEDKKVLQVMYGS